ncbi:MAG: xylose isomerase [Puniceicoccaceae bacterium]|nr:MAG: xylose isomerase [Puniceicoccaceae bacterium]
MPKTSSPPRLIQFASFWTLTGQPLGRREWTTATKIRKAREAGFDAMAGGPSAETAAAVRKAGMEYICFIDANGKNWQQRLAAAAETRPLRINVQLGDHDTPPELAVHTWIHLTEKAEALGIEADLEVHRDTCTETPEKTRQIALLCLEAAGRPCRFSYDFSHFAVVKHLSPPYAPRLLDDKPLLRGARQLHLRPFNGHHAQIPLTDGRGRLTPEARPYLDFVGALFDAWLEDKTGGETLCVCPEFGPVAHGYGLGCFPDVWADAVRLREETEDIWRTCLRARR